MGLFEKRPLRISDLQKSDPSQTVSMDPTPCGRMQGRTRTQRPAKCGSTSGAVSMDCRSSAASSVAVLTGAEHQPSRVLISVL